MTAIGGSLDRNIMNQRFFFFKKKKKERKEKETFRHLWATYIGTNDCIYFQTEK